MAQKNKKKIILIAAALILSGLFLLRFINTKAAGRSQAAARHLAEKITVRAIEARRQDLDFFLSYVGSIKSKDEAAVYSKAAGKLIEYKLNQGEKVKKGQVIALLDRDETGLTYESVKIESPISGILASTLLDKGANVLPAGTAGGGTVVAVVVNMGQMSVKLNISEPDLPYIANGLKAIIKVDAYPEDSFSGIITKVSEVVDPYTRTLPIEITISDAQQKLKSGMFARIEILASQHKNALVLPQDAIVYENGANYAFLTDDSIARKKKVTLGIMQDGAIEILDGINEGQSVIVFGQQGLKDGTPVEVVKE